MVATAPGLVARAWALLEQIPDPEIPVLSIRELGILRTIEPGPGGLHVVLTPTYSGCPAIEQIQGDVQARLAAHGIAARVTLQLAPVWTTDWIAPEARDKLRAYGIAPPKGPPETGARVVQFARKRLGSDSAVPCPRCGSHDTTETSHFGSTACKSLWRCLACREPFDHFKPY